MINTILNFYTGVIFGWLLISLTFFTFNPIEFFKFIGDGYDGFG